MPQAAQYPVSDAAPSYHGEDKRDHGTDDCGQDSETPRMTSAPADGTAWPGPPQSAARGHHEERHSEPISSRLRWVRHGLITERRVAAGNDEAQLMTPLVLTTVSAPARRDATESGLVLQPDFVTWRHSGVNAKRPPLDDHWL